MGDGDAELEVVFRPHWVGGWFVKAFAVPLIDVDGREFRGSWRRPTRIAIAPGPHRISCCIRYRGTRAALGALPGTVEPAPGRSTVVTARNGPLNHQPFRLTVDGHPL